ncbi:MAG: hypothetical protein KatS3mg068_2735 [Candidatus Sericytochromatia bacterium]|nr:MAG: hypothetical protein KatS3mg068_2735 [Candidatus Sericytochromatia bacterium]
MKIESGNVRKVIISVYYGQEQLNDNKKIKAIFGKKWNPQGKYWEVLYSDDLIAKLQSFFVGSGT